MKNRLKLFGIVAVVAAIALSMTGCPNGNGVSDNDVSGNGGRPPVLTDFFGWWKSTGGYYYISATEIRWSSGSNPGTHSLLSVTEAVNGNLLTNTEFPGGFVFVSIGGIRTLYLSTNRTRFIDGGDNVIYTRQAGGGGNDNGVNDDNNGFLGATLNLSGYVYSWMYTEEWPTFARFPVGENRTFSSNLGVNGQITNGQLSFIMDTPAESHMWDIAYLFGHIDMDVDLDYFTTFSDPSARFAELLSFRAPGGSISREYQSYSPRRRTRTFYIYVDRDVTVTMENRILWRENAWDEWEAAASTVLTEPFVLAFRKGWNAVNINTKTVWTEIPSLETITTTVSMGDLGHPIRWVFEGTVGYTVSTLSLSGQVWTRDWHDNYKFTGNMAVGLNGEITNGYLNFTTNWLSMLGNVANEFSFLSDHFMFTVSPANARAGTLSLWATSPFTGGTFPDGLPIVMGGRWPPTSLYPLSRQQSVYIDSENGWSKTHDEVRYIYVDRNVTIIGRSHMADADDLNITLSVGWNTIHLRRQVVETWYPESIHYETVTVSTVDLSIDEVRWVLRWE